MYIPSWIVLDVYNLVLVSVMYIFVKNNSSNAKYEKWYGVLMILVFGLVCGSLMSGETVGMIEIGSLLFKTGNFIVFAFDPLIPYVTFRYMETCLGFNEDESKHIRRIIFAIFVFNILITIVSEIFSINVFYYYDEDNVFVRGTFYMIRAAILMVEFIIIEVYMLIKVKQNKNDYFKILILFPIITVLMGIGQVYLKKLSFIYTGVIFYALVLYIYVQSRNANVDFLTGAVNRRKFEMELIKRIENSDNAGFSGIMIDVDYFKHINDTYGHDAGDRALGIVYEIIFKSFRRTDIIARYGGDEFCILTDISDKDILDKAIERFKNNIESFNKSGKLEYKIYISIGYSVYDKNESSAAAFLKDLDDKMYEEKREHHRLTEERGSI